MHRVLLHGDTPLVYFSNEVVEVILLSEGTVVVLCVCLFVCLSATILALQATRRLMNDTNSFSATSTRFSPFSAPWTNEVTKGICIQVQRCSKPIHDHAASL